MRILVRLDVMLALRKVRAKDLAAAVGITEANLSLLRTGKVKGVRFDTLARICAALQCTPGDILEFDPNADDASPEGLEAGVEPVAEGGPLRGKD